MVVGAVEVFVSIVEPGVLGTPESFVFDEQAVSAKTKVLVTAKKVLGSCLAKDRLLGLSISARVVAAVVVDRSG